MVPEGKAVLLTRGVPRIGDPVTSRIRQKTRITEETKMSAFAFIGITNRLSVWGTPTNCLWGLKIRIFCLSGSYCLAFNPSEPTPGILALREKHSLFSHQTGAGIGRIVDSSFRQGFHELHNNNRDERETETEQGPAESAAV